MEPVRKSITVNATPEHAFRVFTEGIDSWWPREHHIGTAQLKKSVIEGRPGGRCYSEQTDGSESPWGSVLVWDPPQRLVLAWQITPHWKFEPDLSKSSEVEVSFTPEPGGHTRVDLNHRYWERHGEGAEAMRNQVDAPNGWNGLLRLFAAATEKVAA
jgi:uncharacterized protein YndB with AHSA1/START domain